MKSSVETEQRANPAITPVIEARGLSLSYGPKRILNDISFEVRRGEVLAIVGGSGSGKSTLMRLLALLQPATKGELHLFGKQASAFNETEENAYRRRIGVSFQQGALFGDMTVLENVCVPLQEYTGLTATSIEQAGMLKILLAGLRVEAAALYPSQLSGGMRKRASVARAIALDPEILFLDEPSSGLDPISADAMDELVLQLKDTLGLTIVLVTHDMNSLWTVADRVLLLADAGIAAIDTIGSLTRSSNPAAQQFFNSRRGRAARIEHG
jgi:phospholipid/cholesterol/gamma-HCH transport system ATP-binding protein